MKDLAREDRHERQQRKPQKRRHRGEHGQRENRRLAPRVGEAALERIQHRLVLGWPNVGHRERHQRDDHDQERDAVEAEASGRPERRHRHAREQRAEDAGEVELDRVERDGVREIFLVDERRDHGLVGRPPERLRQPGGEGQREDVADMHASLIDERRERERGGHLDELRADEQPLPIVAVGDDAAEEREEEDRQLSQEVVEPEIERRLGEVEHEPALRDFLHPGADGRGEGAEPQHPEIAVRERGEGALEDGRAQSSRCWRRRRHCVGPSILTA